MFSYSYIMVCKVRQILDNGQNAEPDIFRFCMKCSEKGIIFVPSSGFWDGALLFLKSQIAVWDAFYNH